MSRFNHLPNSLQKSLSQRSLLKVIAGLNNFEKESVTRIARVAGKGGADLLDVSCDPDLVKLAKQQSGIPICVSAVDPALFPEAIKSGASMIEIGNFDTFYSKGRFFSAEEVLALTLETRKLLPEVVLSVTVPHILPLDQQAELAIDLVEKGADIIQTEGGTSAKPLGSGILGFIEKASPTLAAAYSISEALRKIQADIPVICASGLSSITAPMALSVGASGVGVGSAVNRLNNEIEMLAVVKSIKESIVSVKDLIKK